MSKVLKDASFYRGIGDPKPEVSENDIAKHIEYAARDNKESVTFYQNSVLTEGFYDFIIENKSYFEYKGFKVNVDLHPEFNNNSYDNVTISW